MPNHLFGGFGFGCTGIGGLCIGFCCPRRIGANINKNEKKIIFFITHCCMRRLFLELSITPGLFFSIIQCKRGDLLLNQALDLFLAKAVRYRAVHMLYKENVKSFAYLQ